MREISNGSSGQPDSAANALRRRVTDIPLAGVTTAILERRIPREQQLVPEGYRIGRTELQAALLRVARNGYPGYPSFSADPEQNQRLQLNFEEWNNAGRPAETLVGTVDDRPSWYVADHVGRRGIAPERMDHYDGSQDLHDRDFGGAERDSNGAPLHPEIAFILDNGLGVTSLAYNWRLGERKTGDAIVFRICDEGENKGKLQFFAVTRRADNRLVLPGETAEGTDADLSEVVNRAVHEEMGVPLDEVRTWRRLPEPLYDGLGADERDTPYSWRAAHGEALFPTKEQADRLEAYATRDEEEVSGKGWKDVTKAAELAALHPELVKAGIEAVRVTTGLVVDKDGFVGVPEDVSHTFGK